MKRIIPAIVVAFAFLVAGPSITIGEAEAKGWCKKHELSNFCLKKEARKERRDVRKETRRGEKKSSLFGVTQQNVNVTVVQEQRRDKDRDTYSRDRDRRGGWDKDRDRYGWGRGPNWYRPYRPDPGTAIIGGIIGGFIGNVFAPRPEPVVVERAREGVVLQPWTADWYAHCANKYQSFDPKTGLFTTYDGRRLFCQ